MDDYRTFWIYTDGERWCMGYVRPDLTRKNAMKYGRTAIYSASMRDFKIDKCINVYKRVVQMVRLAYNSTPRNSRADLTEEDDTDPQTIAADIVIERMKNSWLYFILIHLTISTIMASPRASAHLKSLFHLNIRNQE